MAKNGSNGNGANGHGSNGCEPVKRGAHGHFAKGVSGNPAGRRAEKPIRDALWAALMEEAKDAEGRPTKNLVLLARAVVERGKDGDINAAKMIAERVDGKTVQKVEVDVKAPPQELPDEVLMGIIQHFTGKEEGPDATDAQEGPAGPN